MLINEVCKKCNMTKKAVEYYVEQGLVFPSVQENGYRSFSEGDLECLKKIAVLRSLEVPVVEIRQLLLSKASSTWNELAGKEFLKAAFQKERQEIIQVLSAGQDWEQAWERLGQLEEKRSVLERMLHAFPGYYGRYLCLHFAPFLTEPAVTKEQREAFHTVIDFLDAVVLEIPAELGEYLEEMTAGISNDALREISANVEKAAQDTASYIEAHRQELETYFAYKRTEEYRNGPAGRLEALLKEFTQKSGYEQVFLPAMRQLSSSYAEYSQRLLKADEFFLKQYPQMVSEEKNL